MSLQKLQKLLTNLTFQRKEAHFGQNVLLAAEKLNWSYWSNVFGAYVGRMTPIGSKNIWPI